MPTATLKDGRNIEFLPDMIGDGAMKEVYFTKDKSEVVCFYKDPKAGSDPVRIRRLEKILGPNNPTLPRDPAGVWLRPGWLDATIFKSSTCHRAHILSRLARVRWKGQQTGQEKAGNSRGKKAS